MSSAEQPSSLTKIQPTIVVCQPGVILVTVLHVLWQSRTGMAVGRARSSPVYLCIHVSMQGNGRTSMSQQLTFPLIVKDDDVQIGGLVEACEDAGKGDKVARLTLLPSKMSTLM